MSETSSKSGATAGVFALLAILVGGFLVMRVVPAVIVAKEVVGQASAAQPASCTVTLAGYREIRAGMTYEQVVDALGCEGEEASNTEIAGNKAVIYEWTGDNFSVMTAMFQGSHTLKLISKFQAGLK